MDPAGAYKRSYERIRSLVRDDNADTEVPTCPGWTVKGIVDHQADFLAVFRDDPKGGFSDGWGDRGVQKRDGQTLKESLDEWKELIDASGIFESPMAQVAVADVLAHEQDIRSAVGEPGAREDENIAPSIRMGLSFLEQKTKEGGLPTLKFVTENIDHQIGEGEPALTLRTSNYELFRVIHGRRTVEQVRELDWSGDPDPWMKDLFLFGPTERVVEEA